MNKYAKVVFTRVEDNKILNKGTQEQVDEAVKRTIGPKSALNSYDYLLDKDIEVGAFVVVEAKGEMHFGLVKEVHSDESKLNYRPSAKILQEMVDISARTQKAIVAMEVDKIRKEMQEYIDNRKFVNEFKDSVNDKDGEELLSRFNSVTSKYLA